MKNAIKVESCWHGADNKFSWCFTLRSGERVMIPKCWAAWRRSEATRALDVLEMHGIDRRTVRFHFV
jgi:hypothetical protein